jgi:hypothetical protein
LKNSRRIRRDGESLFGKEEKGRKKNPILAFYKAGLCLCPAIFLIFFENIEKKAPRFKQKKNLCFEKKAEKAQEPLQQFDDLFYNSIRRDKFAKSHKKKKKRNEKNGQKKQYFQKKSK